MNKKKFYVYWGISFLIISLIAFAPRYWMPILQGDADISSTIHWHALFSSLWIILFFLQALLITKKNLQIHQYLGFFSILIAVGVLISGFYVSVALTEKGIVSENPGAKPVLLINLLDIVMFGTLYFWGIIKRKDPLKHKRLMTLAGIVLMNAAYFRIGRLIIGGGFGSILLAVVLTSSVILLFLKLEKRHSGKEHKTFLKIALAVILIHIIRIPLAITPVWANITDWILKYS